MTWIITLYIAVLLGIATALVARKKATAKEAPTAFVTQAPRLYSNLPPIEMVDFHALFRKWED